MTKHIFWGRFFAFLLVFSLVLSPTASAIVGPVRVAQAAYPCPCSIWTPAATPAIPAQAESLPVELGVVFKTDVGVSGYITGVRFYKGTGNTGTHYGHLWTTSGTLLGTATFANETATGWQEAAFPTPILIEANTPYIVSYHTSTGHWSLTSAGLTSQVYNEPLTALASSASPLGNGVYKYGPSGSFPNETYGNSNYWVDVVFDTSVPADITAPTVSTVTPAHSTTDVNRNSNLTVLFNEEMALATLNTTNFVLTGPEGPVEASVSYTSGSYTATLDPTTILAGPTTYTATIKGGATGVTDLAGNPLASDYVWSFTTIAPDTTPPTISVVSPVNLATNVDRNANLTAQFSEPMAASTINAANFVLTGPGGIIPAAVSYAAGTNIATLNPDTTLVGSTIYTATIKGDPSGVTDLEGNLLAGDYSWSFTTTAPDSVPPTVSVVTPASGALDVDYYVNVTAQFNEAMAPGSINATNFVLTGPSGAVPATVSYTSGSFTATLNPDAALVGSTIYTATIKGAPSGVTDLEGNLLVADYSWSFTTIAPDETAPTISAVAPLSGATGSSGYANVTVRFNEAMDAATITAANFELSGPGGVVPATISYASGSYTATLDPTSVLTGSTPYTATIKGGASGVADLAGNHLAADYTWTFTTAMPPDQGPGGPILIIAHASNPFGRYYAEILRNEGMNEFAVADIGAVTEETLAAYDVVILGEMALSSAQVTMLSNWVTAGGNLIAMRPDKQLAGLLGLTDASGVLPPTGTLNAYLLVNTAQEPGSGIVNQTIQYHGLADLYTLSGATAVATLYSTSTTPTTNPAVTVRSVGESGGQAAAFTYDLARSVVYTRQGNPAWAGQNRDVNDPSVSRIITHDMYYGNASWDPQPDYVDSTKLTIPQADEQQRLLANLIHFMNRDKKPLPHFWYFPRGEKAVVIMTGDDHGGGTGTIGRYDIYKTISPVGCSVDNWECIRASSYMFISGAMTDAQAAGYNADGFEIGLHVNTGCVDWTPTSLANFYQNQLTSWYAFYPSLPAQMSERTHCVNWTDWVTQAKVQASHGIRMDTNYYYYPPVWVNERPGMYTGSGMPMRFADLDGTMIDVYQGVTQMTDEFSFQGYGYFNPLQINTLLDNAVGAPGFYGAFLANMHTDSAVHAGSVTIINAALARGIPVISARQMVTWLDGRNASSFGNISWSNRTLNFTITPGTGSNGIQAMVPTTSKGGFLTGITRGGSAVTFTTQTIKGIEYAFFDASAGTYAATYAPDETPPVISNVAALPAADGTARITWTTDEPSSSHIEYGITDALGTPVSNAALVTSHEINLTGLTPGLTYYYRVTSSDFSGNSTTYPTAGNPPLTFRAPSACLIDTTVADFSGGSLVPNTYITNAAGGEVTLAPAIATEFNGSALPPDWFVAQYPANGTGGTAAPAGGELIVDGARVGPNATFGPAARWILSPLLPPEYIITLVSG